MSRWEHRISQLSTLDAARRIFGARSPVKGWGHEYLAHPVGAQELEAFELWCGCTLPPAYRHYILEVGLGPGPYYGLMPFEKIRRELANIYQDYAEELGTTGTPGSPFALEEELVGLKARGPEGVRAFTAPRSPGGFIPISDQGCEFLTVMVTTGPLAGSVFTTTEFATAASEWHPATRPPGIASFPPQATVPRDFPAWPDFTQWVDGWLDQSFYDLRDDPGNTPK